MMDFNLPPDVASTPVTYEALFEILDHVAQLIETNNNSTHDGLMSSFGLIMDSIKEAEYKRRRDINFTINMISAINLRSREKMYELYNDWCEEYDKLNKGDKNEN